MRSGDKVAVVALLSLSVVFAGSVGTAAALAGPLLLREAFVAAQPAPDEAPPAPPAGEPATPQTERSPDRGTDEPGNLRPPGTQTPLADVEAYRAQEIDWQSCGSYQCAEVVAPLDWDLPAKSGITLSLRQIPASQGPALGTIFINPGGPGGSGVELVDDFATDGLEQYDIVGWDPRGTGDSTPVVCGSDEDLDELYSVDDSPDSEAEFDELAEAWRAFGELCLRDSGLLLENVSTVDTAKDLDLLRELVGDQELNYLGYSYGTIIGQAYIELFGDRVGRLVLDSVAPLPADDTGSRMLGGGGQIAGFDAAMKEFARWCADQSDCELGGSETAVLNVITTMLDQLDSTPIEVDDRELTQSLAVTGLVGALYADDGRWPVLADAIADAADGDGAALLAAADAYNGRNSDGSYSSQPTAFRAINCLDAADAGVEQARLDAEDASSVSDIFGPYFGPNLACPTWPVPPALPISQQFPEQDPFLVLAVTGDPATPYEWSTAYAEQQPGATLITLEGSGHTAYGRDECVDQAVVEYFVDGSVPDAELRCD